MGSAGMWGIPEARCGCGSVIFDGICPGSGGGHVMRFTPRFGARRHATVIDIAPVGTYYSSCK